MKNTLITLVVLAMTLLSLNAQTTNKFDTTVALSTNVVESGREVNSIELTLGGGGSVIKSESVFGADFTLSINPIKARPEVWVGIAQGLYWEPSFAGSTDLYVDWSQDIWNDTIFLNAGWSGGVLYDTEDTKIWRTGPEVSLQYYTHDNCFIFVGANYDIWVSEGEKEFRYSFGIGILF